MAASLKTDGWHVQEEAYHRLLDGAKTHAGVVNSLLNTDLKEVAAAGLPADFVKSKPAKLIGPLVLQIQKLRNVSAPTSRQESSAAPRMFKFSLTDGFQNIPAIELEPLHNVGFGTAPGSKLQVKGHAQVNQGIVLLTNGNCKLLGGKVDAMSEKWQLNKDLLKISRNTNRADGPPPFVPFGQKIKKEQVQQQLTGKFNSLEIASATPAVERDNAEFDAQRKAVIDVALQQSGGSKKTYGGIKQVDAGVPLVKAEFKRPERKTKKPTLDDKDPNVSDDEDQGRGRGRRGRRSRFGQEEEEEHLAPGRPSAANTLFDFLGGRLASNDSAGKNESGPKAIQASHSHPSEQDGRRKGYNDYSSAKHDNSQRYTQEPRSNEGHTATRGDSRRPHSATQSTGQHRHGNQSGVGNLRQHDYNQYSSQSAAGNPRQHDNNRHSNQSKTRETNYANDSYRQQRNKTDSRSGGWTPNSVPPGYAQLDERRDNSNRDSHSVSGRKPATARNDNSHSGSISEGSRTSGRKSTTQAGPRVDNSNKSSQSAKTAGTVEGQKKDGRVYAGKMYSDDAQYGSRPSQGSAKRETGNTGSSVACNPGDIVMAKYWEDGQFYKYRVTSCVSAKVVRGIFLDYGNTEDVQLRDIKPNPQHHDHGTQATGSVQARHPQQTTGSLRHGVYDGDYSQGLSFSRSHSGR